MQRGLKDKMSSAPYNFHQSNENIDVGEIWHPYTQMKLAENPIFITQGKGTLLYDNRGNTYIDAISSWWVNIHGHTHPKIVRAIHKQAKKLEHTIFAGFTHEPAIELSKTLLSLLPDNQDKVFFSDNGSTAVEVALKMAIQYWSNQNKPKRKIVTFKNGYHGDTFGAMSVSNRGFFTQPFHKHLFDTLYLDIPDVNNIASVLQNLEELTKSQDVAAFIFEPLVQGVAGMVMYEKEYLDQVISICKKNHVLTIADEVMTGFFRLGKMFASNFLQEKPDIICLSKGLTGGFLPLGVTSATENIFSQFFSDDRTKTFFHGHSYTGNPISCSAAIASLDLLQNKKVQEKIKNIEKKHFIFSQRIQKILTELGTFRMKGTILAIEIKHHGKTSYFHNLRDQLYQFYIKQGILLRPLGNIIYVMPPYCISDRQLNQVYNAIQESLLLISKKANIGS